MRTMVSAIFLLLSAFSWCRGAEEMQAVTGSNVIFTAKVDGRPSEITWLVTYSESNISKIVDVEEGKDPDVFRSFKNRVIADLREKTLILMNVTPADSLPYTARSYVNDKLSESEFHLKVYDHVCTVGIKDNAVEDTAMLLLSCNCSARGDSPSQYKWYNGSRSVSERQDITVSKEEKSQNLMCVASNGFSSSKANFTVPARTPDEKPTNIAAIIVPIFIAIIITAVILCYWKKKRLFSLCRSKTEAKIIAENKEGEPMIDTKPPEDASDCNDKNSQDLKPAGDS